MAGFSPFPAFAFGGYFMKFRIFKLVFVLFIVFIPFKSFAIGTGFTPLTIPFIVPELMSPPGPSPIAGLYFWLQAQLSSFVDSSGNIKQPAVSAWVDLTQNPPAVVQKNLNANMPFSEAQKISGKKDSNGNPIYPNVYNALNGPSYCVPSGTSGAAGCVNSEMQISGATGPLTCPNGFTWFMGGCANVPSGSRVLGSGPYTVDYCMGGTTYRASNCYYGGTSPPLALLPSSQAVPNLTGSPSGGSVSANTALQSELDKMFQDSDYVPSFSDATTGLPYAPPPSNTVMSPDALKQYNDAGAGLGSSTPGTAGSPGTSGGAGGSTSTSPSGSGSTSGGSPGTPFSGTNGTAGTAPTPYQPGTNGNPGTPGTVGNIGTAGTFNVPALHTLDFSSGKQLIGVLQNTYPINLLPSLGASLSNFVFASPTPPIFKLPMPLGTTLVIDLTLFDGIATICRFFIGSLMTVGLILAIINFWRGVS